MPHHLGAWLPGTATHCGAMHTSERNSCASGIILLAQTAEHHEETKMTLV